MELSEVRAARDRLILKRNQIIKGLRERSDSWPELHQVCREIVELDRTLGDLPDDEQVQTALCQGIPDSGVSETIKRRPLVSASIDCF